MRARPTAPAAVARAAVAVALARHVEAQSAPCSRRWSRPVDVPGTQELVRRHHPRIRQRRARAAAHRPAAAVGRRRPAVAAALAREVGPVGARAAAGGRAHGVAGHAGELVRRHHPAARQRRARPQFAEPPPQLGLSPLIVASLPSTPCRCAPSRRCRCPCRCPPCCPARSTRRRSPAATSPAAVTAEYNRRNEDHTRVQTCHAESLLRGSYGMRSLFRIGISPITPRRPERREEVVELAAAAQGLGEPAGVP